MDQGTRDAATAGASVLRIGDRGVDVVQGVGLGVQGDEAPLREVHQFHEVVVGADEVADHVDLAGDDLDGVEVERAAVADDEVRPAVGEQRRRLLLRPGLADEVEDDLRAAVRDLATWSTCAPSASTVWWAPICSASSRASGFGSTVISVAVSARSDWMPMCPSPPAPTTTQWVPGYSSGSGLRTAW